MDEFFFSMDSAGSVGLTLVPNESRLVPSLPNFLFEKPTLGRRKIRNSSLLTTLSTFCILLSLPFSEKVAKCAGRAPVFPPAKPFTTNSTL